METKVIDSIRTRAKVRQKYGSVLAFCRDAKVSDNYFSMLLNDPRRGKRMGQGQSILNRLKDEGLVVYESNDIREVA